MTERDDETPTPPDASGEAEIEHEVTGDDTSAGGAHGPVPPVDPFAGLGGLMGGIPGGNYIAQMIQNNPDIQDALSGVDPTDPAGSEAGLRRLLGAFGMVGPQADSMIQMAQSMMSDPAALQQAAAQMGVPMPPGFGPPPSAAEEPKAPVVVVDPWRGCIAEVTRLLADGSERSAFERMAAILDDPLTSEFDPRDARFSELEALLEVYAAESRASGRQIPLRFVDLYRRLALHAGFERPTPDANPAFTEWCASLVEHLSKPR